MLQQKYIFTCDYKGCGVKVELDTYTIPEGWVSFVFFDGVSNKAKEGRGHLCCGHNREFQQMLVPDIVGRKSEGVY